jgi:hypothetical protein
MYSASPGTQYYLKFSQTLFARGTGGGAFGYGDFSGTMIVQVGDKSLAELPQAIAGADQAVFIGNLVQLDGSSSYDPGGQPLSYEWTQTAGPEVVLSNPLIANPTFSPTSAGIYVFELLVNNGLLNSAPDYVTITVSQAVNQPPIADAGTDQNVHVGSTVTLDGSGSDPDGDLPLSYSWSFVSKPADSIAQLSNPMTHNPSFIADKLGDYKLELVVTDALGAASAPDQVLVSTENIPPVADAGPDQAVIQIGSLVTLNGAGSYDPDGDPFSYNWSMAAKPIGSVAVLSDNTSKTPTFTADMHGDYVINLVVRDSYNALSSPDIVTVSFDNVKPVANAGLHQSVKIGDVVTLSGSGYDANFDILTYSWTMSEKPNDSLADFTDALAPSTQFIADKVGTYVATLVVNDGFEHSDPSSVTIVASFISDDEIIQILHEMIETINGLPDDAFKNRNMRKPLAHKLLAVIQKVQDSLYQEAHDKLENDVMGKLDGCSVGGKALKNDWIEDCNTQEPIYAALMEVLAMLGD